MRSSLSGTLHLTDSFEQRPKELNVLPAYQIIPLTPEEFKRLLEKKDLLAVEALKIGVILREDVKIDDLLVSSKSNL